MPVPITRVRVVTLLVLALAAGLTAFVVMRPATPAAAAQTTSTNVQVFYYPWYADPTTSGAWRHWNGTGITPPESITSNFYPAAGPYDSNDPATVDRQMREITEAGIGTIVYSWWGQGSFEDTRVPTVLASAARYGIKVAFHIEPYTNRSAQSVVADINYLNATYGGSPAYYRDTAHGDKPAFYIFQSLFIADWSPIVPLLASNLILAQTTDTSKVADFNGMYTYDGIAGQNPGNWAQVGAYCAAHGMVWAPSVAPGYDDDRAVPGNTTPTVDRANGAAYDKEWTNAITPSLGGNPNWVSITSFNEWHEGSQIEPATATPPAGYGYLTYSGAYGLTGSASQNAYLDRTRYWVSQFTHGAVSPVPSGTPTGAPSSRQPSTSPTPRPSSTPSQPPAGTNLALHKAVNASQTQGYAPGNAVDGNTGSYWESTNNAFPQSITVDLGSSLTVGRMVLTLPPAASWATRTQTLSVSGSVDNSAYSTVAGPAGYTFNPATGNAVTVAFAARQTRYLRLAFTGNTGWPAAQLSELELFAS